MQRYNNSRHLSPSLNWNFKQSAREVGMNLSNKGERENGRGEEEREERGEIRKHMWERATEKEKREHSRSWSVPREEWCFYFARRGWVLKE